MKFSFWSIFFLIWTPLAILVGWWLWQVRADEATVVLAGAERNILVLGKLFHRNLYPVYPWVLLAPYVFFVCSRFPFGVGRWHVVLPVLILAAGIFVMLATPLVRQMARNTPSMIYVDSSGAASLKRAEFADELVDLFRKGLADADTPPPKIRRLDDGGFEIKSVKVESGNVEIPVSVVTEFTIDLAKEPGVVLDDSVHRILVLATENELAMTVSANSANAPDAPVVGTPRERLWLAGGLQLGGFALLATLGHAVVYFRQFREREQRNLRLARELTEARLGNLKSRLQPHFLFNSLNGISSYIHEEPDRAVDMVGHLGDLLRQSLEYGENDSFIRLEDELAVLNHYLELQSMRFGDRLQISREIDSGTLKVEIPPFVLQPLAENVIRHAVETSPKSRNLTIGSRLEGNRLKLRVTDDGPGPDEDSLNPGTGTGLRNLRERLETIFPGDHRLTITEGEGGAGTVATLELPIREPA